MDIKLIFFNYLDKLKKDLTFVNADHYIVEIPYSHYSVGLEEQIRQWFKTNGRTCEFKLHSIEFTVDFVWRYGSMDYRKRIMLPRLGVSPPKLEGCQYEWKQYVGFTETYEYCDKCGIKKEDL